MTINAAVEATQARHPVLSNGYGSIQIDGFSGLTPKKCFCIMAEGYRYQEHGISTGSVLFCQRAAEINDGDLIVVKENGAFALYLYLKDRKVKADGKKRILHNKSKAYVDKQSGRSFERTNYLALRNTILRKGDVLVVKSIDRFGRNYSAIRAEWEFLTKTLGVDIVVLDTPILDTTQYKDLLGSVITDIVLAVLSFGAQLEVDTKSKAQAEGIAAAHLKGVKFGRPRCTVEGWDTYYPQWKQGQITAVQCYKQLGISASTFYRLVRKYELEDESE